IRIDSSVSIRVGSKKNDSLWTKLTCYLRGDIDYFFHFNHGPSSFKCRFRRRGPGSLRCWVTQTGLSSRTESETLSTCRTSSDDRRFPCGPWPRSGVCPAKSLSPTAIARREYPKSPAPSRVVCKQ